MENDPDAKISGKIMFGVDYLNLMSWMGFPDKNEDPKRYDQYGNLMYAMAQLFLLQWDFSVDEIDETQRLFQEKMANDSLDERISAVIERLVKFIKNDKLAIERLITEMTAIAHVDREISPKENWLADNFKDTFDLAPSEFRRLDKRGIDWVIAFDYLGYQYNELEKRKNLGLP